ncbi:MAG: L-lactate dehydrogenase [Firmicutes bacterium]|jgi:L-lactate dehydrogenase|nr:L-lactate dehydrogenase [Bacillota bacterium]
MRHLRLRRRRNKITVVGAGLVGSTFAYTLMISGLVSEIVLVDVDAARAEGQAMDLNHGASFVPPVRVQSGGWEDSARSDIVAITAGVAQKPGESRLDLVRRNVDIFRSIIPEIVKASPEAILLVVTNPVDIMTYATMKLSGLPEEHIVGSGTLLDSSRFRHLLSRHCHIAPGNVHAYIIGEHGDSEVPVWSTANVAGLKLDEYCPVCGRGCKDEIRDHIFEQVRGAAYAIIERKGATYYAIALAMTAIVRAILRDENAVMTVSVPAKGHYGVDDICLSLPAVITRAGVSRVLKIPLSPEEERGFRESGRVLASVARDVGLRDTP